MTSKPKYQIDFHSTSIHDNDHEACFKVRSNGKAFWIQITPSSNFKNSPLTTAKYLSYLKVLCWQEEVLDDIYDTDVYDWVMAPGLSQIKVSLQENLFPEYFTFDLDVIDEKLCPRRIITTEDPLRPSFGRFDDDFLDDLQTWTTLWDPRALDVVFENPEDALFREARKVILRRTQIECFYKPCHSSVAAMLELKAYKAITAAGLYEQQQQQDGGANLCRVHGVVLDDFEFVLGILLSHVDCGDLPLSMRVIPEERDEPPMTTRRRWMRQLESTVSKLHAADIIWGDVKAANVLIDEKNNPWIIDFGGGYTEGWVEGGVAGTVQGDVMGMAKMRELLVPEGLRSINK